MNHVNYTIWEHEDKVGLFDFNEVNLNFPNTNSCNFIYEQKYEHSTNIQKSSFPQR